MTSNAELEAKLAALQDEMALLRAAIVPTPEPRRVVSRRNLLRAAPVAAIGAGIAALSAAPAAAATGSPVLQGKVNAAGTNQTTTVSGGTEVTMDANYDGVSAYTTPGLAVDGGLHADWLYTDAMSLGEGHGSAGLIVYPNAPDISLGAKFTGPDNLDPYNQGNGTAVLIENRGAGLVVEVTDGYTGFHGDSPGYVVPYDGISVETQTGSALDLSSNQTVIGAASTDATATADAVTVSYAGKGRGLYVESHLTTNVNGTITGVNDGAGIGVWGENKNTTAAGFGVVGVGNKAGRGARLSGGAANVQLLPSTATTHPTTGKAGDLFVDSTARLWYCQKASSGSTAATWKQLA